MTNKANHKNRSRWAIDLLANPETVGGLQLLGSIDRNGLVDPLLADGTGQFWAQTPHGLEPLRADKVGAAIRSAEQRKSDV